MNSTVSENQTSSVQMVCIESYPGYLSAISVMALDFIVPLPIHIWVLWLGTSSVRTRGRLAASEIFTMNLSALEIVIILYSVIMVFFGFLYEYTMYLIYFFSGSDLIGRPLINSLICVERYMAVAHPSMYRNPAFVKHRYIGAGLVWLLIAAYGIVAVSIFPSPEIYISCLTISISVITACSLGVLKILLRPSPGETQNEGMNHQKKRAFVIITGILVSISVPYGLDILIFTVLMDIPKDVSCVLISINLWLMQQGSIIQSLLYLSKHGVFSCIRKVLIKPAQNLEATSS